MIEIAAGTGDDLLEIRALCPITARHYELVLMPTIEEALAASGPVRLPFRIGLGFDGASAWLRN